MKFITYISILFSILSCMSPAENKQDKILNTKEINISIPEKIIERNGEVKRGQGFFQSLQNLGIKHSTSMQIINALRDEVEFSKLKVGDKLTTKMNQAGKVIEFSFSNSPAEQHILKLNEQNQDFHYSFKQEPTHWRYRVISGNLQKGSTLQGDLLGHGLSPVTVADAVNALLCKINFRYHARMGDKYDILLHERIYQEKIIQTNVLYTSYDGERTGHSETYFYDDGDKSTYTAHYTEDGQALIRSGLRYPVNKLHIRSHYGMRRHPVTGRRAMHRGVDLRGRTGDKVHAVARGYVTESYYHPFGGNKIVIKHADGSKSYYLHLNSRSVKKGQFVLSHQVIGTVGATGRVTGPHLHFGFKKANGQWMNPMNKRMIATPKLKGERYANLQRQVLEIKNSLIALKYKDEGKGKYVLAFNRKPANLKLDDLFEINI